MTTRSEPSESPPKLDDAPRPSADAPSAALTESLASAEQLEPRDQLRLAARLMESMPRNDLSALLAFGAERLRDPQDPVRKVTAPKPQVDPLWPFLRERLFDPTKASGIYSAPRRFDLATIFVVTAAYSILFGALTAMDYGPITKISVGLLVTVVAASQAFFQHVANPRGVSIVAGAITQSILLLMLSIFVRNWLEFPLIVVLILYGLIGGAIAGYLCGALVGGVFLVADRLRVMFENRAKAKLAKTNTGDVD